MRVVGSSVLLVTLLLVGAWAAPTPDGTKCTQKCELTSSPYPAYQPGKIFTYTYEAENDVSLPGTTNDKGRLRITATYEATMIDFCDLAVRLTNVQLSGDSHASPADLAAFKAALEDKPFIMAITADGRLHELCFSEKEPVWVSNIKRGMVSASSFSPAVFVEKKVRSIETDIHGHCETHSEQVSNDGQNIVIQSTKILGTCTENHGHITAIQADYYNSYSPLQNLPVFRSTQECLTTIKAGVFDSLECKENHVLIAFSKDKYGATTTNYQKFKYQGSKDGTFKNIPRNLVRKSVVYDYSVEHSTSAGAEQEVVAAIQELCQYTKDDIRPEAPNTFTKLHDLVARLPAATLQTIYRRVESGQLCPSKKTKDIFLDAIATAGSEGAVKQMVELLVSGKISRVRARFWYARLALIQNPTPEVVAAALPLLDQPNPHKTAYLGISALAHAYCRKHENCEKEKAISLLLEKLQRSLGNKCKTNSNDELNKVIVTLKAYGNLGLVGSALPVLSECIRDPTLDVEVRVAALEAFRRQPCINQHVFWEILEDEHQDSELRITAYLNLIRCPNHKTFIRIKGLLEHEEVNQVGSFIWTHLENLQETSAQYKQTARSIVSNSVLNRKFALDDRKYSANYELSNYIRNINLGGSVESNVIFSQHSFLPRSVSFNVTADLFGHSFNFVELGVRVNGLERKLEELFGPTGKLKEHSLRDVVKSRLNEVVTGQRGRSRREVPYKKQKLMSYKEQSTIEVESEVDASISVKVFGNELSWLNARDLRKLLAGSSGQRYGGSKDFFDKIAKDHMVEFGRSFHIIDSTLVIPSATGIPIKLAINATAVVGLKAEGHADYRKLFASPRALDIKSSVKPSFAIEVSRSLVIDAHVTRCGIKLRRTTHSSTALDHTLVWKQGEEIQGSLKLGKDNQEVLSGKNEILIIHHNSEHLVKLNNADKYEVKACTIYLQEFLGIELCGEAQLPKPLLNPERPYLPLGGPMSFSVTLQKTDPSQQGIVFKAVRKSQRDGNGNLVRKEFELTFDTPGSQKNREFSMGYLLDRQAKKLTAKLRTPYRKYDLEGVKLKDSDTEMQYKATLTADNERKYILDISSQGDGGSRKINAELTTPKQKYTIVTGTIGFDSNTGSLNVDLKSSDKIWGKPFFINGNVAVGPSTTFDLNVGTPSGEGKWKGSVDIDGTNKVKSQANIEYKLFRTGDAKYTVTVNSEMNHDQASQRILYKNEIKSSRFPDYNRKIELDYNYGPTGPNNKLDIKYGGDFSDANKHIQVEWRYQRQGTLQSGVVVDRILKITYPRRDIDFESKSYLRYEPHRAFEHKFAVRGGILFQSFSSEFAYKNMSPERVNKLVEWKVSIPNRDLIYKRTVVEKKPGEYRGELLVQWQKGKTITIVGDRRDKSTNDVTRYETEHTITVYSKPDPIKVMTLIHCEEHKHVFKGRYVSGPTQYHVEYNHEHKDDKTGDLKVDLKLPSVVGKLTGKRTETSKTADLDVKLFNDRRIAGQLSVSIAGEVRSVNLNVKLDADANPNRKLVFVGTVKRNPNSIRRAEFQGSLELPTKKFDGTLKYALPDRILDGHHVFKTDLVYDGSKKILVDVDIDIDRSDEGRRTSHGKIHVVTPYTDERKLVYSTRLERSEDVKAVLGNFKVSSPGLDDLLFDISAERGAHAIGASLGFGFGDRVLKLGLGGKFLIQGDKKDVGFNIDIRTPIENAKALVLSFDHYAVRNEHVGRVRHASKVIIFDPDREFSLKVDWNRKGCREDGLTLRSSFDIVTPFQIYKNPHGRLNFEYQPMPYKRIDGELDLYIREEKQIRATVDYTRTDKGIKGHLNYDAPHRSFKTIDIQLTHNRNHPNYDTEIIATWEPGKRIHYTAKRVLEKNHLSVNSVLKTTSPVYPEVHFTLTRETKGDKKNGQLSLKAGDSKISLTESSTGSIYGSFETDITITSSADLPFDGWNIKAKRNIQGLNRHTTAKFNLGPGREIDLVVDRKGKPNDGGGQTTVKVSMNGDAVLQSKIDSSYSGSNWRTDKNAQVKIEVENPYTDGPATLELGYGRTISDIYHKMRLCAGKSACYFNEVGIQGIGTTNYREGRFNRTISLKGGHEVGGKKHTLGYYYKNVRVPGSNWDYISKVTFNEEENRFVAFRVNANRKTAGDKKHLNLVAALELPNREAKYTFERTKDSRGYNAKSYFALDAKNQPNSALTGDLKIVYRPNDVYDVTYKLSHPLFPRDITVNSQAVYRQGDTILKASSVISLSADDAKKITLDTELYNFAQNDITAFNYSYVIHVKQDKPRPVDFTVAGQLGRHIGHLLRKFRLTWVNQQGVTQTLKFVGDIDRLHKTIYFKSKSPLRLTEATLQYWYAPDHILYPLLKSNLEVKVDGKLVRRGYLDISRQPFLALKYYADPADQGRVFEVLAERQDPKHFGFVVQRTMGGKTTKDIEGSIKLEQPQLVGIQAKWRPGLLREAVQGAAERIKLIAEKSREVTRTYIPEFIAVVRDYRMNLRSILDAEYKGFCDHIAKNVQEIREGIRAQIDFNHVREVIAKIKDFLREYIHSEALNAALSGGGQLGPLVEALRAALREALANLMERVKLAISSLAENLPKLGEHLQPWRESARAWIESAKKNAQGIKQAYRDLLQYEGSTKTLQALRERVRQIAEKLKEIGTIVAEEIRDIARDFIANIRIKDVVTKYIEWGSDLLNTFSAIIQQMREDSVVFASISDGLVSLLQKCMERINALRQKIHEQRLALQQKLKALYEDAMKNPEFQRIVTRAKEIIEKIINAIRESRSKPLREQIAALFKKIQDHYQNFLTLLAQAAIKIDREAGTLEAKIPLLIPVESLAQLRAPAIDLREYIPKKELIREELKEFIYHFLIPLFKGRLRPPYPAHGVVIGNQHYITYDGRYFEFAGKCEYLLTQDAVDGNFSVVINYDDVKGEQHIVSAVVVSDEHNIEIKPNFQVLLDDQEVELPSNIEKTVIKREWNNVIVSNNKGLTVTVDPKHGFAIVDINGYYFGKTQGLLGLYNYEPSDDLRLVNGKQADSVASFAHGWEVSKDCRSNENYADTREARPGSPAYALCESHFKSRWSKLSLAYPLVNPDPYFHICLQELAKTPEQSTVTEKVCRVAAVYTAVAKREGLDLDLPSSCGKVYA